MLSKPHTLTEALDFARAQEISDKPAKELKWTDKAMKLTPIQRRRYIRSDNRHKARRLERRVFLVVELFRTLKEGGNVQPGERNA